MAKITAALVKALRDKTDAGMMDCKKALKECDCDMEAAVKYLREKGIAKAAAKADRDANEGVVRAIVTDDAKSGIILELNCETDFCAKGDKFQSLVNEVASVLEASSAKSLDEALQVAMPEGNVEETIKAACSSIGENMSLRKFDRLTVDAIGKVASYIHMGGKVGVLIEVTATKPETVESEAFQTLVKDLTLHIAAQAPKSISSAELDPKFIEEEQDIARAQLIQEGKPEHLLEKILPGKLKALYAQSCLLNQAFVKDPSITVEQLVANTGKELGDTITVAAFVRDQLGA